MFASENISRISLTLIYRKRDINDRYEGFRCHKYCDFSCNPERNIKHACLKFQFFTSTLVSCHNRILINMKGQK